MLTLVLSFLGVGSLAAAASFFIPGFLPLAISVLGAILRCKPCLIALAIIAAFITGDIRGHRLSDAKCKAADIAMQLKAAQRDASIAADTAKLAKQQADELSKANDDLNRKVTDYETVIAKRGGPGCPLTGDDVRRLRNIDGQP